MTTPTLQVSIAVENDPTSAAVWVDISAYVHSATWRRGRDGPLSPMQMGTAELLLDNTSRLFDPSYDDGTYYGKLKPVRRVRIQAVWEGDVRDQFYGYVDGWPQSWQDGVRPLVRLRACDGFAVLDGIELNKTYAAQSSDARIAAVLDDVGWTAGLAWVMDSATNSQLGDEDGDPYGTCLLAPVGDRTLLAGNSAIQACTLEGESALSHLQDVAETEDGYFYIGRQGDACFLNRYYRYQPDAYTPIVTFGDGAGEAGYSDFELTQDKGDLYNDVRMTREGGTEQVATDTASGLAFFVRTLSQERLLATTDYEMADRAQYYLARYKTERLRSRSLAFRGGDEAWARLLERDLGDRIRVIRRPQGSTTDTITDDYTIEGIEGAVGRGADGGATWAIRLRLWEALDTQYWRLCADSGDAFEGWAALDGAYALAY